VLGGSTASVGEWDAVENIIALAAAAAIDDGVGQRMFDVDVAEFLPVKRHRGEPGHTLLSGQ